LILALLLLLPLTAHAHGLSDVLLYIGMPLIFIVLILASFIKWCILRFAVTETVGPPLILISLMELCACIAAFYVVGYCDLPLLIYRCRGYETRQASGMAGLDLWASIWFFANVLINRLLVRPANVSSGHPLRWWKRILVSACFGAVSPGLFWLFIIFSE
jgi:hypothetical protein